ncbi:MAG: 3-oxoacyl-ACP reductase [Ilumatobacteraceae bacterium]|nr:3-oxoacyl-ACP reductase [Ilumatobacteraceae bacterium]
MATPQPSNVRPIDDWGKLLDRKIAVVSGGGDGIGGAISRLFAEHGAIVEIAEIDPERAASAQRDIRASGGVAVAEAVDVTDHDAVERFAARVLADHGRVDVLVNNVGDYRPLVRFPQSSPESWKAMYDINLQHVFSMTHAFIGSMMEHRSGSIVNVHSVEGMRGYPGDPVYGAMKAAVAHFTTCLAASHGRNGIRVNGIGPDLTQTPQVDYISGNEDFEHLWPSWAPVGRLGWPEDQARVALFLASDMSGFVTGHNVPVDGGTKAGGGWFFSPTAGRFVNRPTGL